MHPSPARPDTPDESPGPAGTAPLVLCPWCGYSLAGLAVSRCPECGRQFGAAEAEAAAVRHALIGQSRSILARFLALPLVPGALASLLLLLQGRPARTILEVVLAGMLLAALALVAGVPAVLLSRPWERRVVLLSWMRSAWWLQLAWIALPALAGLAAGVGALLGSLNVLFVIVPPWLTLALAGVLAWAGAWHESERHVKHRSPLRAVAIFVGAAIVLLAGIGSALWGGLVLALPYMLD